MKCTNCNCDIILKPMLLTADGDFACSEKCAEQWNLDKDNFFNNIVHDENLFKEWLRS